VDYFAIRAQAAAASSSSSAPGVVPLPSLPGTSQSPPLVARPPPLGARPVARRRQRLLGLRNSGLPAAELQLAGGDKERSPPWPSLALREVAAQLRGRGFVVVDAFCGVPTALELRAGIAGLEMKRGHLGDEGASSDVLRGDSVAWPEVDEHTAFGIALVRWQSALDALVAALRPLLSRPGELAGVRAREPPMASCYPPGARYIRHYDNNCEDGGSADCNGRRLTAVYYLTDVPSDTCGCHLRLAVARGTYDVSPSTDSLVLFWADRRTPHEVLPNASTLQRYALSCWYVDLDEAPGAPARPMPC